MFVLYYGMCIVLTRVVLTNVVLTNAFLINIVLENNFCLYSRQNYVFNMGILVRRQGHARMARVPLPVRPWWVSDAVIFHVPVTWEDF